MTGLGPARFPVRASFERERGDPREHPGSIEHRCSTPTSEEPPSVVARRPARSHRRLSNGIQEGFWNDTPGIVGQFHVLECAPAWEGPDRPPAAPA